MSAVVDDNPRGRRSDLARRRTARPTSRLAAGWIARFQAAKNPYPAGNESCRCTRHGRVLHADSAEGPIELQVRKADSGDRGAAASAFSRSRAGRLPNVVGRRERSSGACERRKSRSRASGCRLVAGSGPLLLGRRGLPAGKHGAVVARIAEQTDRGAARAFRLSIARETSKVSQGLALKWALRGYTVHNRLLARARRLAKIGIEEVELRTQGKKTWREPCDYLACGYRTGSQPRAFRFCSALRDSGRLCRGRRMATNLATRRLLRGAEPVPVGIGGVDLALN